jgi:hypothetical protein
VHFCALIVDEKTSQSFLITRAGKPIDANPLITQRDKQIAGNPHAKLHRCASSNGNDSNASTVSASHIAFAPPTMGGCFHRECL